MKNLSKAAQYTLQFINQTNKSVFLTGKAGTGKTTLLKEIIATSHKNTVVVAPTGIAALNAGGVTIHSMFQLPFAAFIPDFKEVHSNLQQYKFETKSTITKHFRMNGTKKQVLINLELLIIDEVSMLRPDVLDGQGFARPCGGTGPDIAALQHSRDGLGLDGRGQVQAHAVHGAHQCRAQAQFREVQKGDPSGSGGEGGLRLWIGMYSPGLLQMWSHSE